MLRSGERDGGGEEGGPEGGQLETADAAAGTFRFSNLEELKVAPPILEPVLVPELIRLHLHVGGADGPHRVQQLGAGLLDSAV